MHHGAQFCMDLKEIYEKQVECFVMVADVMGLLLESWQVRHPALTTALAQQGTRTKCSRWLIDPIVVMKNTIKDTRFRF